MNANLIHQWPMTNIEAKAWIKQAFELIKQATSLAAITSIENSIGLQEKYKMSAQTYPSIQFALSAADIRSLQENGILTKGNEISPDFSAKVQDPLAKLLYALIWKNGDLKKIRHIVAGILNEGGKDDEEKENGLVFYQFGKYLKKEPGEPIIDQHVLRTFGIYQATESDEKEITRLRKLSSITKKDKDLIAAYKDWLQAGDGLQECFRNTEGYTYHLDKLLFAIGRAVKLNKRGVRVPAQAPDHLLNQTF
jgi:hypothetical protein